MIGSVTEGVLAVFITLTRILVAFALAAVSAFAVYVAWLSLMPMWWWVDYDGVNIIDRTEDQPELVEVVRSVPKRQGVIPVMRFTELHEPREDGSVIQHCPVVTWTTAEYRTNPRVYFTIPDFLGRQCDLRPLEGKRLHLQITYDIELALYIRKQKSFYLGPFMVRDNELFALVPNGETVEESLTPSYTPHLHAGAPVEPAGPQAAPPR